jgi:hypothetical protein
MLDITPPRQHIYIYGIKRSELHSARKILRVKGKLLKKFSLKIPFKTFHASADDAASPAPSARISEKILVKGLMKTF